jgi:hypothetical protein
MISGQFSPNFQPELNRLSQSHQTPGPASWFQVVFRSPGQNGPYSRDSRRQSRAEMPAACIDAACTLI